MAVLGPLLSATSPSAGVDELGVAIDGLTVADVDGLTVAEVDGLTVAEAELDGLTVAELAGLTIVEVAGLAVTGSAGLAVALPACLSDPPALERSFEPPFAVGFLVAFVGLMAIRASHAKQRRVTVWRPGAC